MVATDYDAIVVGARCAGSPTAMLLARKGYRVLLVDRATFPSDTVSTLVIHARGAAALRRWGLLDRVAASGCPPLTTYTMDFGPLTISGRPRAVEGVATAYAPRRTVLDAILVEAAAAAGAEVREGFNVDEVLIEDGVVAGIRGRGHGGGPVTARARVVIGADGRGSRVARAVQAPEYHQQPVLERAVYSFWSGLPGDRFETVIRGDRGWAAIPTNDGLTLLLVGCPAAQSAAFRADLEANYLATFERDPAWAGRVRAARREERFTAGGVPNFFRTPYGPGWALVGDAGYCKDPITAQGISDAFRSAELCTAALDQVWRGERTFAGAMSGYQRTRDEEALPIYGFTTELARLEPPPPEQQQLLAAVHGNQEAMDDFLSVGAGSLSPADFFAPENVGRIFQAAAVPA